MRYNGHLRNKKNLMEELRKMNRIIDRGISRRIRENLVVLDVRPDRTRWYRHEEFARNYGSDRYYLTKMDGTAKTVLR